MFGGLYCAGVRRPFGFVPKIPDVPYWLWHAEKRVQVADWIFVIFVVTMLFVLFLRMNFAVFFICSGLFFFFAEFLSYKIRLVASFYISLALAALSIALIVPQDWLAIIFNAPASLCDEAYRMVSEVGDWLHVAASGAAM